MDKAFEKVLLERSENDSFVEACKEWMCTDYKKTPAYCVCGQKLKHVYKIENTINKNIIFPVGSECVKNATGLEQSMKDIKHKKNPANKKFYCKWCGSRHRNKSNVCNICKTGEYIIGFGKYQFQTFNMIHNNHPGYFDFIKNEVKHRYKGRLQTFYETKIKSN